jgi:hypothetical protein
MILTYTLSPGDYLNYHLFAASLSETLKQQRTRNRIVWSIVLLCLAFAFYGDDDRLTACYFLFFAILCAIFYPYYSRWRSKDAYKEYIHETYKNRFNKVSNLTIDRQQIHDISENSETKISTLEIDKIYETCEYFFLKLKPGMALIIPKLKIDNADLLKVELQSIADERHISFIEMKNWK